MLILTEHYEEKVCSNHQESKKEKERKKLGILYRKVVKKTLHEIIPSRSMHEYMADRPVPYFKTDDIST